MLFMVIERFKDRDPIPVYRRVRDSGIKFPEGLSYVGSWIEPNFDRCFQLMECDDARLLQEWILNCQGLGMTFEIIPVVPRRKPGKWSRRFWIRNSVTGEPACRFFPASNEPWHPPNRQIVTGGLHCPDFADAAKHPF
jgi:hypothetical protein